MFVVTVEFVIAPEHEPEFMPLMLDNARLSRTTEAGCRQFDVCTDTARPVTVFLYERYDDEAAFNAHLATPHYKAFAEQVKVMITRRTIGRWQQVAPLV